MGEEVIEIFMEVDVGFVIEENLVVVFEEFGGDIDDGGFDESRGVEDFVSYVMGGGNDDEFVG